MYGWIMGEISEKRLKYLRVTEADVINEKVKKREFARG